MNYQLFLTLFFLCLITAGAGLLACMLSAWADCSNAAPARVIRGILG